MKMSLLLFFWIRVNSSVFSRFSFLLVLEKLPETCIRVPRYVYVNRGKCTCTSFREFSWLFVIKIRSRDRLPTKFKWVETRLVSRNKATFVTLGHLLKLFKTQRTPSLLFILNFSPKNHIFFSFTFHNSNYRRLLIN